MAAPLVIPTAEIQAWIGSFLWPFMRVGMMLTIMPVFGGRLVPKRIRLVAALVLTLVVMPLVPPVPQIDPLSVQGVLISIHQLLIGLAMGFAMQMVFSALVIAGQTVAMSMGLGFASMVDPQNGVQVPVVGQYYVVIATLLFLALNGHLALIELLAGSFQTLPVAIDGLTRHDFFSLAAWASEMFAGGMLIALPAVSALLTVNIAFGVITRAAPQMNIFAVGFPVTLTVGFIVLVVATTALLPQMSNMMHGALDLAAGLVGGAP